MLLYGRLPSEKNGQVREIYCNDFCIIEIFLQYQGHVENAQSTTLGDNSLPFCIDFLQLLWVTLAFSAKT